MRPAKEYLTVCAIGSLGYETLELLWRGFTHWSTWRICGCRGVHFYGAR